MDFNECLKKRIAKKVNEDKELITSLIKTSQNKLDSEKKLELSEVTSSSKISLLYDSLRELLEALRKRKLGEKESYESVIWDLIEDTIELSEETKRDIEEARKQIKDGKIHKFEDIKKEEEL